MKISLIGPVYPYRGGIAHFTALLAKKLIEAGHEVHVVSLKKQYPAWLYPGKSDNDHSPGRVKVEAAYLLTPMNPYTWRRTVREIVAFEPKQVIVPWWVTFWGLAFRFVINRLKRRGILVTVLVKQADIDALEWVAENTPEDSRFFINSAHWLNNVYRGVDGGGWLQPYSGRWALVPTVFYGFSPDREWHATLRSWGEAANTITTCSEDFWWLVEEAELDWVYLRAGVGSLQPGGLAGGERVEVKNETDGVGIYQMFDWFNFLKFSFDRHYFLC